MAARKHAQHSLLQSKEFFETVAFLESILPPHSWVLIGGLATAYYANPPVTVDVDVLFDDYDWSNRKEEMLDLLAESDWKSRPLFFATGLKGYPRTGMAFRKKGFARADILFTGKDKFLRRAVRDRQSMKAQSLTIPVIQPENLIIMKKLAGREKDDEDADAIWDALEGKLDVNYIQDTLERLM